MPSTQNRGVQCRFTVPPQWTGDAPRYGRLAKLIVTWTEIPEGEASQALSLRLSMQG